MALSVKDKETVLRKLVENRVKQIKSLKERIEYCCWVCDEVEMDRSIFDQMAGAVGILLAHVKDQFPLLAEEIDPIPIKTKNPNKNAAHQKPKKVLRPSKSKTPEYNTCRGSVIRLE